MHRSPIANSLNVGGVPAKVPGRRGGRQGLVDGIAEGAEIAVLPHQSHRLAVHQKSFLVGPDEGRGNAAGMELALDGNVRHSVVAHCFYLGGVISII